MRFREPGDHPQEWFGTGLVAGAIIGSAIGYVLAAAISGRTLRKLKAAGKGSADRFAPSNNGHAAAGAANGSTSVERVESAPNGGLEES
jgi:gas vesicle protein